MSHVLLSLAEFVLVLGGISIFLMVLFFLGLGLAAWGISRMFSSKASQPKRKELSEIDRLRQQLFEARNTAYESALASEKTIQQLQQRLAFLEANAAPSFSSVRH